MIERMQVISSAAVTWLTVAGAVATILMEELTQFPSVVEVIARIAIILATATSIIRRVTPVAVNERGVV